MNPFSGDPGNPNDPNNQMMLMALDQVNESNLIFFLMQNQDLVEEQDNSKFKKSGISIARNLFMTGIAGTFFNIQMKRIPGFLNMTKFLRLPLRIPIFFLPGIFLKNSFDYHLGEMIMMHHKYYTRMLRVKRTGDLRYLDPAGVLSQQFKKKMEQA